MGVEFQEACYCVHFVYMLNSILPPQKGLEIHGEEGVSKTKKRFRKNAFHGGERIFSGTMQ